MDLIDAALRCKKPEGRFAYMSPTYTQSKDTCWQYLKRFTADIPGVEQRESDLMVVFPHGARVRLYGAETYDRLRGIYCDGLVLDEYADINPRAWPEVLRPALADRHGFAVFIGTPRGRNDFWRVHRHAEQTPEWFSLVLRASATGLLQQAELDDMRATLTPEQYDQELECSFDAAIIGSYFGREIADAEREGRIGKVPVDPALPVHTAWDLGIGDSTAVWFFQVTGREVHVIDHYEASGYGLPHYASVLSARGYDYGTHYLPHDAQARQLGSGRSLWETLNSLVNSVPRILPAQNVMDGINAARVTLGSAWFDSNKCYNGLEALRAYRADYDEKAKTFHDRPKHDWSSHCFAPETNVLTRYGTRRIMDLPPTGEVLTPCGWRAYRNPRVTLRDARLVEVRFTGGFTVRCTPDHLFMTANGWKSASDLVTGSQIQSCLTRLPSILTVVSIVCGRVKSICREVAGSCTGMFGSLHSALSQSIAISITGITTRLTTPCLIWNARTEPNIYQLRFPEDGRKGSIRLSLRTLETPRPSGMAPKLVDYGTAAIWSVLKRGRNGGGRIFPAISAARSSQCWSALRGILSGSVGTTAKPLTIASVKRLDERSDVWDITVPGVECFALANGAVVHNSADAFRYLSLAWREMQPAKPEPPPLDSWDRAFATAREADADIEGWRVA